MYFGCLQFSQKMNENNSTWGTIVKSNFFVHFLGELEIPKRHFEIKWPLSNVRRKRVISSNFVANRIVFPRIQPYLDTTFYKFLTTSFLCSNFHQHFVRNQWKIKLVSTNFLKIAILFVFNYLCKVSVL